MEFPIVPEQDLGYNDQFFDLCNVMKRKYHLIGELIDADDLEDFLVGRKRKRTEAMTYGIYFSITAIKVNKETTLKYRLSSERPDWNENFPKFYQKLLKPAIAKMCLTLCCPDNVKLVTFKDKEFELSSDSLLFTEIRTDFDWATWCNPQSRIGGRVSLTVCSKDSKARKKFMYKHTFKLNKKILQDMDYADAKIVANNGAELPCHKAFLSAQSSFFQRMFASGMKEAVSSSVTLDDISELGVRAMLNYIYCGNVDEAESNCEVALQLLIAGDKYDIPGLENEMRDLLIGQPIDWFSTLVAVDLWQFANKKDQNEPNDNYAKLKEKAVRVLKTKPEREIQECPAMLKMLEDRDVGIVEFCAYLLKM